MPRKLSGENSLIKPLICPKVGLVNQEPKEFVLKMRMIPIAANIPLMTDEGNSLRLHQALKSPSVSRNKPATITASRNISRSRQAK